MKHVITVVSRNLLARTPYRTNASRTIKIDNVHRNLSNLWCESVGRLGYQKKSRKWWWNNRWQLRRCSDYWCYLRSFSWSSIKFVCLASIHPPDHHNLRNWRAIVNRPSTIVNWHAEPAHLFKPIVLPLFRLVAHRRRACVCTVLQSPSNSSQGKAFGWHTPI